MSYFARKKALFPSIAWKFLLPALGIRSRINLNVKQEVKNNICPLCRGALVNKTSQDQTRDYFLCLNCNLTFVPSAQFLSVADERARYDLHQNSPDDQRYRQFLSRVFNPMQKRLSPGSYGLDFGSGPGPTLSVMFKEIGHSVEIYDIFYAREPSVLNRQYDFITATEVLEHLHNPGQELDRLWTLLKPGGNLGIMTRLVEDQETFSRWYYKNEPTHVCFYSRRTFQWLAGRWQAEVEFAGKDVILFHKQCSHPDTQ